MVRAPTANVLSYVHGLQMCIASAYLLLATVVRLQPCAVCA